MLDHRDAAATGSDDGIDLSALDQRPERVQEAPGRLQSLVTVSSVERRLPAARLPGRKRHIGAVLFEKHCRRQADLGVESVDHAGNEEGDPRTGSRWGSRGHRDTRWSV